MPQRDKTGPEGKGPKTGRQMGNCKGAKALERFGFGRGKGRGRRCQRFNRFQEDSQEE